MKNVTPGIRVAWNDGDLKHTGRVREHLTERIWLVVRDSESIELLCRVHDSQMRRIVPRKKKEPEGKSWWVNFYGCSMGSPHPSKERALEVSQGKHSRMVRMVEVEEIK